VLRSQSDLNGIARLSSVSSSAKKRSRPLSPFRRYGNLRLVPGSAHELGSNQGRVFNLLSNRLQLCPYLIKFNARILKLLAQVDGPLIAKLLELPCQIVPLPLYPQ